MEFSWRRLMKSARVGAYLQGSCGTEYRKGSAQRKTEIRRARREEIVDPCVPNDRAGIPYT
jgi:hypothetical protein